MKYTIEFTVTVDAPRPERTAFLAWEQIADKTEWKECIVLTEQPQGGLEQTRLEFFPLRIEQKGLPEYSEYLTDTLLP